MLKIVLLELLMLKLLLSFLFMRPILATLAKNLDTTKNGVKEFVKSSKCRAKKWGDYVDDELCRDDEFKKNQATSLAVSPVEEIQMFNQ